MTAKYLSAMWAAIAPALGDHLWQSTAFAVVAGFLTLILRKNHARVRYWIWQAASVKFLIPFSLLVGIGSRVARLRGATGTTAGLYFAMDEVSQPFTRATTAISEVSSSTAWASLVHLLPALLLALWLCGFLLVLSIWYARWRRISALRREAVPLSKGRELEALRRLEHAGGMRRRIEMFVSRTTLEPGIFGVARPVLLWPEGISERLDDAHLEAILAHELWHVWRHDNLAAAIHMVVEAVFWFHPLVWWLGTRLVDERERACDEEVLEVIRERQVYAESILQVCEFCVGSPLSCVSGVTGADLKKRIVDIMNGNVVRKLDLTKKLLLGAAGLLAIVLPLAFGLVNAPPSRAQSQVDDLAAITPAYQVTSIKANQSGGKILAGRVLVTPDGLNLTGITLRALIHFAYGVGDHQISGGPSWLDSERYDIEAKTDKSVADELRQLSDVQRKDVNQRMLQGLLADQFQLRLHPETRVLSEYALLVGENGPKLTPAANDPRAPSGLLSHFNRFGPGTLVAHGAAISLLADYISGQPEINRAVLDETGLRGDYDYTLQWMPDQRQARMLNGEDGQPGTDNRGWSESSGPSIFAALQEQLGLKLEARTGPVRILVIDHAEQPAEN
jgi:bla regulator protein BlaR1